MIYLDHNATTPPAPAVVQAMLATMTDVWGNASSQHPQGQHAKRALAAARSAVAKALGCRQAEIVFTSGATEANHLAVRGLYAAAAGDGRRRIVMSAVEHAAQRAHARALAAQGMQVDFIGVHGDGTLDLDAAARLIGDDVALVSLMAANNETGVLMPVDAVAALARDAGARMHVDATQWIGKMPFDFAAFPADAVSFSAHKLRGPQGVGALLVRQGVALVPQVPGSQERGRRGGTVNLPAIAGMAAALDALGDVASTARHVAQRRNALERGLQSALPDVHVFGGTAPRVAGTSYLRFGRLPADVVLQRLEQLAVCASSGAACSSSGSEPSHVLKAMGVSRDEAFAAVRFSLGETTTVAEIAFVLEALPPLLAPLLENDAAHAV